jgi:hypothetical protein
MRLRIGFFDFDFDPDFDPNESRRPGDLIGTAAELAPWRRTPARLPAGDGDTVSSAAEPSRPQPLGRAPCRPPVPLPVETRADAQ